MMTTAAAPSLICEALPAVTVPLGSKTGFSLARPATVVSARGPSSVSKWISFQLPFSRTRTSRGTISSANLPDPTAAAAFMCEW